MQYWLYKNNRDGGPAGYWGDWATHVFGSAKAIEWGGSYSTTSPEVHRTLDERVAVGDLVVAYQTDDKCIVGFCAITAIKGGAGGRKLYLQPIHRLKTPLKIHKAKHGTILEGSSAVNGRVMLRELTKAEMRELLRLASAPAALLTGRPKVPYTP